MSVHDGMYRYVRKPDALRYIRAGWLMIGECPAHHGAWSFLMRACECNPKGRRP